MICALGPPCVRYITIGLMGLYFVFPTRHIEADNPGQNLMKGYIARERGIVVLSKGGTAFPGTGV